MRRTIPPMCGARARAAAHALSVSKQDRLATFDSAISIRAVQGAQPHHLELLAA